MQDTPVPSFFADLTAADRAQLFTDAHLRTLPGALAAIPDPRKRRGQRYDLPFLLTCLVAALLCDCNSLEAVGRWTRDQQALLARVCGRRRHYTPTGSLYRRLLPRLSVAHVERALGSWVQQTRPVRDREPLTFDGKTLRGARTATQRAPHLLSVSTQQSHETLVQVRVEDKTNEIPVAQGLLPHLALRGRVITADALHTQTALAQVILDQCAAYLFTVKDNQPRLHAELAAYFADPRATARTAQSIDRRRGRTETRTLAASTRLNAYLRTYFAFPGLAQIIRLIRTVQEHGTTRTASVYVLTSFPCRPVRPRRSGCWS
jgi:predicted transposase YbfD/YdcC